jgi:hypothetical protein
MYEQRNKDINKASVEALYRISKVLGCSIEDLLENPVAQLLHFRDQETTVSIHAKRSYIVVNKFYYIGAFLSSVILC